MKKRLILFLKILIVLIGISAVTFMLWEPHLEGRNVNATLFQIYFQDPFLAYVYVGSIAFFVALYQAFKLLKLAGQNKTFSPEAIKMLQNIKCCAMILIAFIVGAEAYFFVFVRGTDDIAGGVAMGLFMLFISITVAVVAHISEKALQKAQI